MGLRRQIGCLLPVAVLTAVGVSSVLGDVTDPAETGEGTAAGSCEITLQSFAAPGCETLLEDTAAAADPTDSWGTIECQSDSRHAVVSGGDPSPTAAGTPQGDDAARRLTVQDGDDFYGERCELGRNDHRKSPTALYREGERRLTFMSLRLGEDFPLTTSKWQTVVQMKQAQPSAAGGGGPILELQVYEDAWRLIGAPQGPAGSLALAGHSPPDRRVERRRQLWSAPASVGRWTRVAFDVTYSQHQSKGSVSLHLDANGDGDAADAGEQSSTFNVSTLKTETSGGWEGDGIAPGESIPSHLRTGVYHDPAIDCPGGCSVDVDNVQVVAAG